MADDTLLRLQETDTAIDRLTARREALASGEAIADVRGASDGAEMALGELRLKIDEMDRDARGFEREIDAFQQKEDAETKRMYDGSIVNTKELEALQHEIDGTKRRRSDREDELLALMEQREDLEARTKEAEAEATTLRARYEEADAAAREELVTVEAGLAEATEQRAGLAAALDAEVVELYEELRKSKRGVGAAALVDGVCQGCHEQLSAVEVDRIKKGSGIPRCEHCWRILILATSA